MLFYVFLPCCFYKIIRQSVEDIDAQLGGMLINKLNKITKSLSGNCIAACNTAEFVILHKQDL
jgi:hypothetical protein